jgi:hypothetical protein
METAAGGEGGREEKQVSVYFILFRFILMRVEGGGSRERESERWMGIKVGDED